MSKESNKPQEIIVWEEETDSEIDIDPVNFKDKSQDTKGMNDKEYPVVPYDIFVGQKYKDFLGQKNKYIDISKIVKVDKKPDLQTNVKYEIVEFGKYKLNLDLICINEQLDSKQEKNNIKGKVKVIEENKPKIKRVKFSELYKEIYLNYEKPTIARLIHYLVVKVAKILINIKRNVLDNIVSWFIFILRSFYKNLLRDRITILNTFIVLGILVVGCVSYSMAAEIYSEANAIEAFGKGFEVKKEVIYELGEPVILDPTYFLEESSLEYADLVSIKSPILNNSHFVYDQELKTIRGYGVPILPCGEYVIQICYSDLIKESKIIVKDTTPPDLTNCQLYNTRYVNVMQGTSEIDLRGLIVISVEDYSLEEKRIKDYSSLKVIADTSNINTSIPKKHYIDVVVEDKYGNKTDPFTLTVNVKAKEIQRLKEVKQKDSKTKSDLDDTSNSDNNIISE